MSTRANPRVCAIVVAAGSSRRMQGRDKILAPLAGKPVIVWSVQTLQDSPLVDRIVLVAGAGNLAALRELAREQGWAKVAEVCRGGARRQDSVAAGLKHLKDCPWTLVQDGARPFLTTALIENGLAAARESGAAIAAVPLTDTVKIAANDMTVSETLPRERLWAVQTPQIFRSDILLEAYRQNALEATDDAALVERCGHKVKLFQGSYDNIKITTPHDLAWAELLIKIHGR